VVSLFPNPVVAESLLDRLINTSHQVLVDGPSYRLQATRHQDHMTPITTAR
jgi:DNA replication protein DnaC